jgi:hypothetical protein
MVAEGVGSIVGNIGSSITTEGGSSYGMLASGPLALAINAGSITTTSVDSYGMGAENVALALNLGEIETEGEAAHGMQAQNLGIAVNMTGFPTLTAWISSPCPIHCWISLIPSGSSRERS